jgi:hypothetical protein
VPLILRQRGLALYTIDGELAVDRVCLFENLHEELEALRVRLELPGKLELPHAKTSFRRDKREARVILTDDEKSRIKDLFRREISLFGYEV